MEQKIEEGKVYLMIGNEDGTLSPIAMKKRDAQMIGIFISQLFEDSNFQKLQSKYKLI